MKKGKEHLVKDSVVDLYVISMNTVQPRIFSVQFEVSPRRSDF